MEKYIEVDFVTRSEDHKNLLIAQLSELGFEGFEEDRLTLKAFIPESSYDPQLLEEWCGKGQQEYAISVIEQQNWNALWEAGYEPVVVGKFCAIRAHFHPAIEGVQYEIVITPKMSFGTGHHATTCMMIEAMEALDVTGKKVFDFGTGTAVLAILAEKMGAASIDAIDNDDWSIENGKENLERNNCSRVNLYKADSPPVDGKFDLILANINRNIILQQLASIAGCLLPGGVLLVSGLLASDYDELVRAMATHGLSLTASMEKNSWICLRFDNSGKINQV